MVLVTGGTGLVGSHLLYQLVKSDNKVRALYRDDRKIDQVRRVFSYYSGNDDELFKNVEWVKGDVLDLYSLNEAFKEVKKVYHCAATVAIGGTNKKDLIEANVTGTENIVNLSIDNQVEKLCHVSSVASLGNAKNGNNITENSNWGTSKSRSAYAISKYKSEMEVWRGIQEGLDAVIVNPSVILGPGYWNSGSGSLFTKAAKGMKFYTKGGTGFVDVKDVVDIMIKLMESDITSERFILNSENLTYKAFFELVAGIMNIKKAKKEATKSLLKVASFFDFLVSTVGIKKREITKEVIHSSLSTSKYSNEKIKKYIGKDFLSIEMSLKEIANIFNKDLTIS